MSTMTGVLASEGAVARLHHAGSTEVSRVENFSSLAAATVNTVLLAKIPTGVKVLDVEGYVSGPSAGTIRLAIGGVTLATACVAAATVKIPSLLGMTVSASATATDWRYLAALYNPTTITASNVIRFRVSYKGADS